MTLNSPQSSDNASPSSTADLSASTSTSVRSLLLHRFRSYSKMERCVLAMLVVLVFGACGAFFVRSVYQLPPMPERILSGDLPIKGDFLVIQSAQSYWRKPIEEGPNTDIFRSGVLLLPVVRLEVSGGPAMLRVIFRNDRGEIVGDVIKRRVESSHNFEIVATDGFDLPGMHGGYCAGTTQPWFIEAYENSSNPAAGEDEKKLFEMNISSELR